MSASLVLPMLPVSSRTVPLLPTRATIPRADCRGNMGYVMMMPSTTQAHCRLPDVRVEQIEREDVRVESSHYLRVLSCRVLGWSAVI